MNQVITAVPRSHLGSVCTPRRCGEFLGVMAVKQLETYKGPEKDKNMMPGASTKIFSRETKGGSQGSTSKHQVMKHLPFPN